MANAYVIVHDILTYRNRQKQNRTCKPRKSAYSTIKQSNNTIVRNYYVKLSSDKNKNGNEIINCS